MKGKVEHHARMLRDWQLAILRFAITLDNDDRLSLLAIAGELDLLGPRDREDIAFDFFRRTSADLCAAIENRNETADNVLKRYLARIDDGRMKWAFASAVGIEQPLSPSVRRRAKPDVDLWKGLRRGGSGVHD